MKDEPDLAAWVYWAVVLAAVTVMALLAWFTAAYDVAAGGGR